MPFHSCARSGDVDAIVFGPHFNAMSYVALTNSPDVDEFPFDGAREFPGYALVSAIDGRTFVFVPTEDRRETEVYEVELDGRATPRFGATGRLTEWIRVR